MTLNDPIVAFALLAWLAYIASRLLARTNLPELVGFLLVGAIAGPSGLELLDIDALNAMRPITEGALAILMFVIGERVSVRALRAARWTLTTGIVQYVLCAFSVYWATRWVGGSNAVALVLATLAGAGAPMTIAHIVSTTKASGSYPTGVVGTHAVSDALATTAFAAVLPIAVLSIGASTISTALLDFVQLGIGGAVLGLLGGWMISRVGFQIETSGELLLFVLVNVMLAWVVAGWLDISLPLAALFAGASAATFASEAFSARLFRTLRTIEQPLYLLFFALAGASIHLSDVPKVGLIGLAYVVVRVAAKIVGGLGGGLLGGLGWRVSLRLGVNLTPQAGVAVGLAVLASEELGNIGAEAATVVLGSVVLFELIGPVLVARDLRTWAVGATAEQNAEPEKFKVPSRVLLAAPRTVEIPEWVIDQLARWQASVAVLLPLDEDSDEILALSKHCASKSVEFEFHSLSNESFVGEVIQKRSEVSADYVVLFSDRLASAASRLVLLPTERIARQLKVPMTVFPLEPAEKRHRPLKFPWQIST